MMSTLVVHNTADRVNSSIADSDVTSSVSKDLKKNYRRLDS
jgi:hypothetical protein